MFIKLARELLLGVMLISCAWATPLKPPNPDFDGTVSELVAETSNHIEKATCDDESTDFIIGPCYLGTIGNDFVGTFYDFKRDRTGRDIPMDPFTFSDKVAKFIRNEWNTTNFVSYYKSPRNLYTISFMIPPVLSSIAPILYDEPDTVDGCWLIHYKGPLVHMDEITFRFRGMGDDILMVRVDGKVVLSACNPNNGERGINNIADFWQSNSAESKKYYMGHHLAEVGDWITLDPKEPLDMEVIVGEVSGNVFSAMLAVEVQGVEYPKGPQGNPILPMYTTGPPRQRLMEAIYADLVPGEICVTNGPIFSNYDASRQTYDISVGRSAYYWESDPNQPPMFYDSVKNKLRIWTLLGGETLEATLESVVDETALLTDISGKQRKVPLSLLSIADNEYVELIQPPKFDIVFSAKKLTRAHKENSDTAAALPEHSEYVFNTTLTQISADAYNHNLVVQFFAIGKEIDGDNYILLEHEFGRFTPNEENGRSHELSGTTTLVNEKTIPENDGIFGQRRGYTYSGHLVVVTDERKMIIGYDASHQWFVDILGNLRQFTIGKHFDKTGCRVEPPRPDPIGVY